MINKNLQNSKMEDKNKRKTIPSAVNLKSPPLSRGIIRSGVPSSGVAALADMQPPSDKADTADFKKKPVSAMTEWKAPTTDEVEASQKKYQEQYKKIANCKNPEEKQKLLETLKSEMTIQDKMNMVYNSNVAYGSDQASPAARFDPANGTDAAYDTYIKNLLPDMNDTEREAYLNNINHTGCAYAALTNTLFVEYANRPEEFKETFGFDMYEEGKDGSINYNFDYLMVDLYKSVDTNEGLSSNEYEKVLDNYLKENNANIEADVKKNEDVKKTLNNGGQAIVSQNPNNMFDASGQTQIDDRDAGHAMTITGLNGDKDYNVSSWGEQYVVKPASYPGWSLWSKEGRNNFFGTSSIYFEEK